MVVGSAVSWLCIRGAAVGVLTRKEGPPRAGRARSSGFPGTLAVEAVGDPLDVEWATVKLAGEPALERLVRYPILRWGRSLPPRMRPKIGVQTHGSPVLLTRVFLVLAVAHGLHCVGAGVGVVVDDGGVGLHVALGRNRVGFGGYRYQKLGKDG